ncbi:hypothetical protein O9X98_04940 [Agrobacterium salinitolerans]|nr:hypothetical protein [Agrobacterium salinitolerans]
MSGSMFVAVRTKDGHLHFADAYSRNAYDVFSYTSIFEDDEAKALRYIAFMNGDDVPPTHLRPLEYGVVVVDFITRRILKDSFHDTNIDLMSYLPPHAPFLAEMQAMGRVRQATAAEMRVPVYDLDGNLWNGEGERPDDGSDEDSLRSDKEERLRQGIHVDYAPWTVTCFPETPGGIRAFCRAAEACGFKVDPKQWDGPRRTEANERVEEQAAKACLDAAVRLRESGILGRPLFNVLDDGSYHAHIIVGIPHEGEDVSVLLPVTLPSNLELFAEVRRGLYGDEDIYSNGEFFYSDPIRTRWRDEVFDHHDRVPDAERLSVFAAWLLGAGKSTKWTENMYWLDPVKLPVTTLSNAGAALVTCEASGIPEASIAEYRSQAEAVLAARWAFREGRILASVHEPHWTVEEPYDHEGGPVAVDAKGCGGSGKIHGSFGAHDYASAIRFAELLVALGCGDGAKVQGEIKPFATHHAKHRFHGEEIRKNAFVLMLAVTPRFDRRKLTEMHTVVARELAAVIPDDLECNSSTSSMDADVQWNMWDEWLARWPVASAAIGEITRERLDAARKIRSPFGGRSDELTILQRKAVLDFLTFGSAEIHEASEVERFSITT